jgi:holo-[acyl-carrier-protein] synthase
MIIGIGVDIIETERIAESLDKEGFLKRVYTGEEIKLLQKRKMNAQTAAGNFAAKEAVMKAFGMGMDKLSWTDIEVLREESGAPYINLFGTAKEVYDKLSAKSIRVSISNLKSMALAQVVLEG